MSLVRILACVATAGLTLFAVGALFHLAIPAVAPSIPPQFENASLYRPWPEWTSTYMAIHPFWFGVVFAAFYLSLAARGTVALGWRGGLAYGVAVFLVGSLPVFLLAFASFQTSPEVIVSWIAQSASQYTAAGATVGWVAGQLDRRNT